MKTIGRRAAVRATNSTEVDTRHSPRERLIAQVLDTLRFDGWYFCLSELTAPWALQLPGGRLAAMHAVLEGECVLTVKGERGSLRLLGGDVVVLPRDDIHSLADRPGRRSKPIVTVAGIDRRDRNATTFTYGGGGPRTLLLSASFVADSRTAEAIVAALPATLVLPATTAALARVTPAIALARAEAAQAGSFSAAVLRRVAEILFIQTLREGLLAARPDGGWLAAASDPRLAAALTAMHAEPQRRWTLGGLAQLAHLSRTAFFERFRVHLGQTPTEYLQTLRLQLATRRLRDTGESIGRIALDVGYGSQSAFARVFRRITGRSPSEFRAERSLA